MTWLQLQYETAYWWTFHHVVAILLVALCCGVTIGGALAILRYQRKGDR